MELLAPAGNLEKLKTAVLYGANAVYLAGQKYSLRGASDNFSNSEIESLLSKNSASILMKNNLSSGSTCCSSLRMLILRDESISVYKEIIPL